VVTAIVLAGGGCSRYEEPDVTGLRPALDLLATDARLRTVEPVASLVWDGSEGGVVPIAGWGGVETLSADGTRYAWAIDRIAELHMDIAGGVPLRLEFECWPFSWEDGPKQRVEVEINGVRIGQLDLDRGVHDYRITVPASVTGPGRNHVRLTFDFTERPVSVRPGSTDQRSLAAAFSSIRVEPVGGAADRSGAPVDTADREVWLDPGRAAAARVRLPGRAVLEVHVPDEGRAPVEAWVRDTDDGFTHLGDVPPGGRRRFDLQPWGEQTVEISAVNRSSHGRVSLSGWSVLAESEIISDVPSVILIVIDTLRADHVGVYGGGDLTPTLDRLAREGVWFSTARSHAPITGPSHSSLFTSQLPMTHGVHNNSQLLATEAMTLAEAMRHEGRETAAFVSLGVLQSGFGFRQGFDHYADHFPRDWMKNASEVNHEVLDWLDNRSEGPFFAFVHYSDPHEPYASPDTVVPTVRLSLDGSELASVRADGRTNLIPMTIEPGRHVLRLAGRLGPGSTAFKVPKIIAEGASVDITPYRGWGDTTSGPWSLESPLPASFALLHSGDVPAEVTLKLQVAEVLSVPKVKRRYRGEVRYVDRHVGALLSEVESRGLLDDAIVIVTSDHGEGLGDHGLVGHIHQLYDSLIHVPLIAWGPGRIPPGVRVDDSVSLIDLFPTLSELVDIPLPPSAQGRSLVSVVNDASMLSEAPPSISETYRPEAWHDRRALVSGRHKYIVTRTADGDIVEELYDLVEDPQEIRDLTAERPDVVSRLRGDLAARVDSSSTGSPVEVELTEEEKAQLRALGYLHD
jgi:arylsulfatase A-like enzyme